MIRTVTMRQSTRHKGKPVVRIAVTYKLKWELRLCWAWTGLVLLETECRRFMADFIFLTGNLLKSRQDSGDTLKLYFILCFQHKESHFLPLECHISKYWHKQDMGGGWWNVNNLTYPENSSSEWGSLSSSVAEPSFPEGFSGSFCMVEVRAGWCSPLLMLGLSSQELDAEPDPDTRQPSVLLKLTYFFP